MEITARQKEILDFLIQEHLSSQRPVASKKIVQNYQCSYSSATVRAEMAELEEKGYLRQPYCSAGRVPTDRAYRYYVDNLTTDNLEKRKKKISRAEQEIINLFRLINDDFSELFLRRLLLSLSYLSRSLSLFFWTGENGKRFNYSGLDVFLSIAEKQELSEIQKICRWLSKTEIEPERFWQKVILSLDRENQENDLRVYIGHENPVKEMENWTLILLNYPVDRDQFWSLGVIGQKGMNYPKVIQLMRMIQEEI